MHYVFRPKSNIAWAVLGYLLLAIFLAQSIFYPGANENVVANIAITVSLGITIYLIWLRPKIIFEESALTVVNPFTRTKVVYGEITGLSTHWSLTIDTTGKSIKVWVAPANTRRQGLSKAAIKLKGVNAGTERPHISDSELAARLIQERISNSH